MKYNDKNFVKDTCLNKDFCIIKLSNQNDSNQSYIKEINSKYIQLYFGLDGEGTLQFNNGKYTLPIKKSNSLVLFNPNQSLPINMDIVPNSKVIIVLITIKKFHSFFSEFAQYITFLNEENKEKKYYSAKELTSSEEIVLNQIFTFKLHESLEKLYLKGKIYELLSLYFNFNEDQDAEKCPFLEDEDNVLKIKKAKEIVIENMVEPPTLNELANEIGLPLKKLKDGFKQIYGETVFNFLLNYKLDYARKLLETKKHNVAEVGSMVGYSTSSHFIAAFKKKFGTTPKKHLGKI